MAQGRPKVSGYDIVASLFGASAFAMFVATLVADAAGRRMLVGVFEVCDIVLVLCTVVTVVLFWLPYVAVKESAAAHAAREDDPSTP